MSGARRPAQVFHPADFIREELEARGWTVAELAKRLGRPEHLVAEIVDGREQITRQTAAWLAAAFTVSAEMWLNLQASWDEASSEQRAEGGGE